MSIGAAEIAIVLLFALIIFGPERLPKIARQVGEGIQKLRSSQEKVNTVIQEEIYKPLKDSTAGLTSDLRGIEDAAKTNEGFKSITEDLKGIGDGLKSTLSLETISQIKELKEVETSVKQSLDENERQLAVDLKNIEDKVKTSLDPEPLPSFIERKAAFEAENSTSDDDVTQEDAGEDKATLEGAGEDGGKDA